MLPRLRDVNAPSGHFLETPRHGEHSESQDGKVLTDPPKP